MSPGTTGARGHGVVAAIGGGLLLLLLLGGAVLAMGVVGVDGGGGGGDEEDAAPAAVDATTTTAPTRSTTTRSTGVTTTTVRLRGELDAREVAMHASSGDDFPASSVFDRLSNPAVLRVTATGFGAGATGLIEQCTGRGCGNPFPVTFGDAGTARLQYLVDAEVSAGPGQIASCRSDDPPCVVRVSSSGTVAYVTTVFGGAAPAPRTIAIDTPLDGVADGETVVVTASGFTPGERVQAMLCAAPATFGSARCGAPGPVAHFSIDDDGTGRASLVVARGRVGTDGVACGRDAPCGVAVAAAGTAVPGPVVPISFAAGPSASYDATRVVVGLLVAALLLALATYLVRTTDWRKPTEADTPMLDEAIL